jgi:hypothetical protein
MFLDLNYPFDATNISPSKFIQIGIRPASLQKARNGHVDVNGQMLS